MQSPFIPAEIIKKKREGLEHTDAEIAAMVFGFLDGSVPDYQISAWLMAILFRGMSDRETWCLTETMMHSGRVLDFSHLGSTVDKHSTGGVGDKTTIILAPIVAAAGVRVPMIAGRGLGHTGGTIDKLESIPGFRVERGRRVVTHAWWSPAIRLDVSPVFTRLLVLTEAIDDAGDDDRPEVGFVGHPFDQQRPVEGQGLGIATGEQVGFVDVLPADDESASRFERDTGLGAHSGNVERGWPTYGEAVFAGRDGRFPALLEPG